MQSKTSELAFDIHAGLSEYEVPDFDELRLIGMAATLAIHIRGLAPISYEVLRGVCGLYWSIPSAALEKVVRLLAEAGFVRMVEVGRRIERIIPDIPIFDSVYEGLDAYTKSEMTFNEHEETILALLESLHDAPENRDAVFNRLGADKTVFDRTLEIGRQGGIVNQHLARGRTILISPFYFADNLGALADAAAAHGARNISATLSQVEAHQGWPLSLVRDRGEIGGTRLPPEQIAIIEKLAAEGIIKPPTVQFGGGSESFVFTPQPGKTRLNASKKQIYERAMALIAAVRKGQLMATRYPIRMPVVLLEKLRDRGFIRSNSEASTQYNNLVMLLVGSLKPGSNGYQFHLNKTPENIEALNLAIRLLRTGSTSGLEIDEDARLALTKDERFIQSLVSSRELKKSPTLIRNEEADFEFKQLIMAL